MAKGFMEGLFKHLSLVAAVQDSKDSSGRPDPIKAAAIANAMNGDLSFQDMAELHDMLKRNGAFENETTRNTYRRESRVDDEARKARERARRAQEELEAIESRRKKEAMSWIRDGIAHYKWDKPEERLETAGMVHSWIQCFHKNQPYLPELEKAFQARLDGFGITLEDAIRAREEARQRSMMPRPNPKVEEAWARVREANLNYARLIVEKGTFFHRWERSTNHLETAKEVYAELKRKIGDWECFPEAIELFKKKISEYGLTMEDVEKD